MKHQDHTLKDCGLGLNIYCSWQNMIKEWAEQKAMFNNLQDCGLTSN